MARGDGKAVRGKTRVKLPKPVFGPDGSRRMLLGGSVGNWSGGSSTASATSASDYRSGPTSTSSGSATSAGDYRSGPSGISSGSATSAGDYRSGPSGSSYGGSGGPSRSTTSAAISAGGGSGGVSSSRAGTSTANIAAASSPTGLASTTSTAMNAMVMADRIGVTTPSSSAKNAATRAATQAASLSSPTGFRGTASSISPQVSPVAGYQAAAAAGPSVVDASDFRIGPTVGYTSTSSVPIGTPGLFSPSKQIVGKLTPEEIAASRVAHLELAGYGPIVPNQSVVSPPSDPWGDAVRSLFGPFDQAPTPRGSVIPNQSAVSPPSDPWGDAVRSLFGPFDQAPTPAPAAPKNTTVIGKTSTKPYNPPGLVVPGQSTTVAYDPTPISYNRSVAVPAPSPAISSGMSYIGTSSKPMGMSYTGSMPAPSPSPTYGAAPNMISGAIDALSIVPGNVTFTQVKERVPFAKSPIGASLIEQSKQPLTKEQAIALKAQLPEGSIVTMDASTIDPNKYNAYPAKVAKYDVTVGIPKTATGTVSRSVGQWNPASAPSATSFTQPQRPISRTPASAYAEPVTRENFSFPQRPVSLTPASAYASNQAVAESSNGPSFNVAGRGSSSGYSPASSSYPSAPSASSLQTSAVVAAALGTNPLGGAYSRMDGDGSRLTYAERVRRRRLEEQAAKDQIDSGTTSTGGTTAMRHGGRANGVAQRGWTRGKFR